MSKFIKHSVNFSETDVLKKKVVIPILQKYNEFILQNSLNKTVINESLSFFIPNNSKKYYLLISNKSYKYKTLYFFPDKNQTLDILESNHISDFYVEIDYDKLNLKDSNYLFEGYFYNNNTEYFITDILNINSNIITCDYSLRYSLINNLFNNVKLQNLNGHLSINIHSIFKYTENYTDILTVFKNNFVFKNEISSIEIIKEHNFEKIIYNNPSEKKNAFKKISKSKYIDVYNVNNIDNNNIEGILYIKSLADSVFLHSLLDDQESIILECKFNTHFNKWTKL